MKNLSLTTATLFLISMTFMFSAQATSPDRKTISGSACKAAFPNQNGFLHTGSGFAVVNGDVLIMCPIIRDITRGKKIEFGVSVFNAKASVDAQDSGLFRSESTRCFLDGNDKTGRVVEYALEVNGVGHLSRNRTVNIPSNVESLSLGCYLRNSIIYSYYYMEFPR